MNASKLPVAHRARVDMFGPIHKALRCALADLLVSMGRASFLEDVQAQRVVADLEEVLFLCEGHLAHEDRFVFPRLATRLSGPLESIESAHDAQPRMIAELRALAASVARAPIDKRPLVGRTLYLHYSAFVGEALLHMAEEEQVVEPLLERLFTDEEIEEVRAQIQASLTPSEVERITRFILRAVIEGEGSR